MNPLFGMIEVLQIMVFLPLFSTTMPANVSTFMSFLMTIVAFDYYDITELVEHVFSLEPTEAPQDGNINFTLLGMSSLYFMANLGTATFLFLYTIFATLLYLILNPLRSKLG